MPPAPAPGLPPVVGDAELLARFVRGRDESAFARMVERHGPMVLGVCRRLLGNHHDAEDAFQATFVLLARRAGAINHPERLAGWLHGVAHRTALKLRGRLNRQQEVDRQALPGAAASPPLEAAW